MGQISDAKSVLSVLAAGVKGGDTITLYCEGPDEEEAMEAVTAMFLERLSGVVMKESEEERLLFALINSMMLEQFRTFRF